MPSKITRRGIPLGTWNNDRLRIGTQNILLRYRAESRLTSSQMQMDALQEEFIHTSTDASSLLSMTFAGLAGRLARCASLSLSAGRLGRFSHIATHMIGLGIESGFYEASQRSLTGHSFEGFTESWKRNFIHFGILKSVGHLGANTNAFLQHAAQSSSMVAADYGMYLLGFSEKPQGSFAEQLLHAEAMNVALGLSTQTLHLVTGSRILHLEKRIEIANSVFHISQAPETFSTDNLPIPSLMSDVKSIDDPASFRQKPLRPYQLEANNKVVDHFQQGNDRALVVLPTGTGKTVTFSHLIKRFLYSPEQFPNLARDKKRVLVISHREEIIFQDAQEISNLVGENQVGVYQSGSWDVKGDQPIKDIQERSVVVASAQSLIHEHLDLSEFGLVVLDEAHHYVRDNEWFRPLITMGFFDASGNIIEQKGRYLLGFTATPDRLTGAPLNTTFGTNGLVYQKDITWMVENHYLLDPEGIEVKLRLHQDAVEDPREAFQKTSPTNRAKWIVRIFRNQLREGERFLRTILFTEGKDEVEVHTRELNEGDIDTLGVTNSGIWIKTDKGLEKIEGTSLNDTRTRSFRDFRDGKFDCLANINIATEGFDDPGTEAIIIDRRTHSRALLVQMIGRALRPDPKNPGRRKILIFDLAGNLRRFKLVGNIREMYLAEEAPTPYKNPGRSDTAQSSHEDIFYEASGMDVVTLGSMAEVDRSNNFARALQTLLPTPESIQQLAYQMGIHSDILFNYANSAHLPEHEDVEIIANTIGDREGLLLDAWAWDKVNEMDTQHPLRELSEPEISFVRSTRWAFWRHHRGKKHATTTSGNHLTISARIWDLVTEGKVPQWNQSNSTLQDFFENWRKYVDPQNNRSPDELTKLYEDAYIARQKWNEVIPGRSAEGHTFVDAFRRAVLKRYKGDIPLSVADEKNPLHRILEKGEIPLTNTGSLSMIGIYQQVSDIMNEAFPGQEERIEEIITDALRAEYRTQGRFLPSPADTAPEVDLVRRNLFDAVLKKYRGDIPVKVLAENSPIRNFLERGIFPTQHRPRNSLRQIMNQMLELASSPETTAAERRSWETNMNAAIDVAQGWRAIRSTLSPRLAHLHQMVCEEWATTHGGPPPSIGDNALPLAHPLRRFVSQGNIGRAFSATQRQAIRATFRTSLIELLRPRLGTNAEQEIDAVLEEIPNN